MKFLSLFKRKKAETTITIPFVGKDDLGIIPIVNKAIHGGIHKTKSQQFSMDTTRTGGHMVKTMPKGLRQMKELSEKIDD